MIQEVKQKVNKIQVFNNRYIALAMATYFLLCIA